MPAESIERAVSAISTVTLDCSVAIPWIISEQSNAAIDTLFQDGYRGAIAFVVPILWFAECGSTLNEMVKRRRLTLAQAQEGFTTLRHSRVQADAQPTVETQGRILMLAQTHSITFYDATYLELAQRRQSMLATLDQKLQTAALAAGVLCLSL